MIFIIAVITPEDGKIEFQFTKEALKIAETR